MSSLRPPGLGPIVGHTTDRSCRLWIRAEDPGDEGGRPNSQRRTLGVVALLRKGRQKIAEPLVYYFRLHREYDRTGAFTFGEDRDLGIVGGRPIPLVADTEYTARLGTLTVDDPFPDDEMVPDEQLRARLPDPQIWLDTLQGLAAEESEAVFRTFPAASRLGDRLSFVFGSCRYPGLLWRIKHADRIFGPLHEELKRRRDGVRPSFALMAGDQVYADMFNRVIPIGRADTFAEFQDRYHTAFGARNMRRLLRHSPTYMILDDHEIEDNWTQDRVRLSNKRLLFHIAINAYRSYQWYHGPRNFGDRLYYSYDCAGYPFFVLDERTQRYIDDVEESLEDNHMLGRPSVSEEYPSQSDRLLEWLSAQQARHKNVPKFIVSPGVFAPNPMRARTSLSDRHRLKSDSWPAFPTTRRMLLQHVVDNGIQNVVFLSGDIHCSNVAEIYFTGTPEAEALRMFSITSSSFYWPYPFADGEPSDYVHDSQAPDQKDTFKVSEHVEMDYRAYNFTQVDNFSRVDVDRAQHAITVRVFDKDGALVQQDTRRGKRDRVAKLQLAPW